MFSGEDPRGRAFVLLLRLHHGAFGSWSVPISRNFPCQGLARGEGMGATRIYRCQQPITTILDKSPWDRTVIFIFFCHFSVTSLNCTSVLFEIFLLFSIPPPYTKLKLGKNSGYTCPTLFLGWGEGWACVNWKTPQERKSVPRLLSMIVVSSYRCII